jgi:hypothetical protein
MAQLIQRHREEFDRLHADEREARGLPRDLSASSDVSHLRARIRELEAELKVLR